MAKVEVRLRDVNDPIADSVPFTEVEAHEVDAVIMLLRKWGVSDETGDVYVPDETVGQFVLGPSRAYFEITLGEL